MNLSAAIATLVVLDVAVLGILAFVMSQTTRLKPHGGPAEAYAPRSATTVQRVPVPRLQPGLELAPAQF